MISSDQEALRRAAAQVGLGFPVEAKVESVRLDAETLPFLSGGLSGKSTWRIGFGDLSSAAVDSQAGRIPSIRSLSVLLAPDTGHVLKIVSPQPETAPPIAAFPPVSEEEKQLTGIGERFTRLPEKPPAISLFKSLKIIEVEGSATSAQARQIIVYYVTHETLRYPERAVWVIQVRGLPPFPTSFGDRVMIPEDARNHLRHIVDAQSGQWLSADTVPQPV